VGCWIGYGRWMCRQKRRWWGQGQASETSRSFLLLDRGEGFVQDQAACAAKTKACFRPEIGPQQVKADRIVDTGVDLEELGIMAAVKTGLAPWASTVHATLDKLNMYSSGGVRKNYRTYKSPPPRARAPVVRAASFRVKPPTLSGKHSNVANQGNHGGKVHTFGWLPWDGSRDVSLRSWSDLNPGKRATRLFPEACGADPRSTVQTM